MSFYGSVYYQLIDTFYKIIVKNSGDKTYTFNDVPFNSSETPDNEIIESPAIGRKGVFSLNSGNYWINFSKSDDIDEAAPYKIWHSPAHNDPETSKRISSWDIESDQYTYEKDDKGMETKVLNKDGVEMIEGQDYIQLQDHEFIRMYPSHYDEAGHIIDEQTQPTLYRLPKSDVNEQVNWLMEFIGEPSEQKQLPMWEIPEEERTEGLEQNKDNSVMTLTDYAEKNYEDLRTLESFVGDWSSIAQYWGENWYMAPSITEFIGKVEDMFNDPSVEANNYEEFKNWFNQGWTLTKIIGELPKMWRSVNDGGSNIPISFADAIVKIVQNLSSYKTEMSQRLSVIDAAIEGHGLQIDNIQDTIGTDTRNFGPVYTGMASLQDALSEEMTARSSEDAKLQQNIENEATNRFNADTTLQNNIDNEAKTRKADDETLQDNIDAEEEARIKAVSDLSTAVYAKIAEEKAALSKKIDDDNDAQSATLTAAYQSADKDLGDRLSKALSDAQTTLNGYITALSELHTGHYNELSEDIGEINTTLGEKPAESGTVFTRLANADAEIVKLQNSLGATGEVNVATQISDLNTQIGNIKTGIGASTDAAGAATIYGAIASNKADIDSVKGSYLQQTTASETYLTKSDAKDLYLVEDDVKDLRTTVSNLTVALGEIDTTDGQNVANILTQILNEIEGIKGSLDDINDEIDGIKASILENHPVTEPDPTPDESGEEEPGTDPEATPNE